MIPKAHALRGQGLIPATGFVLASFVTAGLVRLLCPQFLVFAIVGIGVLPLLLVLVLGRDDPFRPLVLVPFTYVLDAVGPVVHGLPYDVEVMNTYLELQTIGILSLVLGIRIGEGRTSGLAAGVEDSAEAENILGLAAYCLLILGGVSLVTQFAAFGGLGSFVGLGYGSARAVVLTANQTFGAGPEWWLLGCICLWFREKRARRRRGQLVTSRLGCPSC